MTNGYDFPGINPIAKSIWRNTQVLSGLGNSEVDRQLFHFGAPNPDIAEMNHGYDPTNLTKLRYTCQIAETQSMMIETLISE